MDPGQSGPRTACGLALLLAASAFAYALGWQQGSARVRQEFGLPGSAGIDGPTIQLAGPGRFTGGPVDGSDQEAATPTGAGGRGQ